MFERNKQPKKRLSLEEDAVWGSEVVGGSEGWMPSEYIVMHVGSSLRMQENTFFKKYKLWEL